MAEPQTLAQTHSAEVWAALLGSFTIIGGLITLLWNRQNNDIKDHEQKLENGQKAFIEIGEQIARIGEQIKSLKTEDTFAGDELEKIQVAIKTLNDRLLVIETEHKNCKTEIHKR